MRRFVIIAHDVPLDGDFSLDDLPGTGGRIDVVCRCVTAALLLSHDLRYDVEVKIVVQNDVTISIDGREIRRLNPDERSTAARLRTALSHRDELVGRRPIEPTPGIEIVADDLARTLETINAADDPIYHLDPEGAPITRESPPDNPTFVLSDHRPFSSADQGTLEEFDPRKRSLSPRSIHADHAITVAHNWVDTNGFTDFQTDR